jgi:negative regulator of flagellin synthesis FlgM
MDNINNVAGNYDKQAYISDTGESKRVDTREEQAVEKSAEPKQGDTVSLSTVSKEMQLAKEAIADSPDIREEKVAALKQSIEEEHYTVNADTVAENLIGASISEIV